MGAGSPFTVTLIGADGSGKTTVTRHLLESLPFACRYLYMGVSTSSSNRILPTTQLFHLVKRRTGSPPDTAGPPDPALAPAPPRSAVARLAKALRGWLYVSVLISEEWYRQFISWWHLTRGRVMIYDRHFFIDYHAYDITRPRTAAQRVHGWILEHLYPRPQLVIFLDAPGEVLFARKGEGTVELLERRRGDYMAVGEQLPHFAVVDAAQPLECVEAEVEELIRYFFGHGGLPDGR